MSSTETKRRRVAGLLIAGAFLAASGILTSALFTDQSTITARTSSGTLDLKVNGADSTSLLEIDGEIIVPGRAVSDVVSLHNVGGPGGVDSVVCFDIAATAEDELNNVLTVFALRTNPDPAGVVHPVNPLDLSSVIYDKDGNALTPFDPAFWDHVLYTGPADRFELGPLELEAGTTGHLAIGAAIATDAPLPAGYAQDKAFDLTIEAAAVQHPRTLPPTSPMASENGADACAALGLPTVNGGQVPLEGVVTGE